MRTCIATVSIAGDLREKLDAIAGAGFDGIEIFEADFLASDLRPREVGRMVRDRGLEIALFQPFRDFECLPEPLRSRAFDRARRKFDLMAELGAELMLVCSSVSPHALGGIQRAADDFRALGEIAAERGLRVGYEALSWGRHVNDHRDAWEVVRRADHPAVGLILDSFHTLARGIDPATIRTIPGDRIFFVQLADAPRITMDLLHWSRHFRTMPGQGDLDLAGFLAAVAATGYAGPLSLEVFNDQFRGASPRTIAADGRRSLLALADRVARAEPALGLELPPMPPPGPIEGVEFVEFATDPAEAGRMGARLQAMGFTRAGRHVSKEVEHWRQGDIHILLNTAEEGFAHSAYVLRGTTVCDIGLRVPDAAAAVGRARVLGAEPFEQPVGEGELAIPAIRGLGGTLLHLIDLRSGLARLWEVDFAPEPSAPGLPEAGLLRIDHIAQTMPHEEMLTGVLFWTALFDTVKTPVVDVVDPGGLVRSQAVATADGAFRVTLNGADSRRTLAGRFVAENLGASVQHVAFACRDILETAAALAARGFQPLEIPANYYDDLAARHGLEPALIERLAAAHVLYDRDEGGGEFFQLYGQSTPEGFFFEIVERRGGYAGYGAANAQVRIAAQARAAGHAAVPRR